jgi:hypothetical protein
MKYIWFLFVIAAGCTHMQTEKKQSQVSAEVPVQTGGQSAVYKNPIAIEGHDIGRSDSGKSR